jgi:hypothetical protein
MASIDQIHGQIFEIGIFSRDANVNKYDNTQA